MSTPTDDRHHAVMAIMISLERSLKTVSDKLEERFIKHSLNYLQSTSGLAVQSEFWTITSYEVVFGKLIGSGGLSVITFQMVEHLTSREIIAVKYIKELGKRPRLPSKF